MLVRYRDYLSRSQVASCDLIRFSNMGLSAKIMWDCVSAGICLGYFVLPIMIFNKNVCTKI
jgi:hypothetical protein